MIKRAILTICVINLASISIASAQVWTCPMHPQIRQSGPGKCPLCSMSLVPVSNSTDSTAASRTNPGRNRTSILAERRAAINKSRARNDSSAAGTSIHDSKALQTESADLEDVCSKYFPAVVAYLSEALKAMQSGDKQTELEKLVKVLDNLITVQKVLDIQVRNQFANSLYCPIKGSPINLDAIDKNLLREYKDRKVAFCCPECPAAWDKLSDVQKQLKLGETKN